MVLFINIKTSYEKSKIYDGFWYFNKASNFFIFDLQNENNSEAVCI